MVLIVDDYAPIRAAIKRYLVSVNADYTFCECSDGDEALKMFRTLRPDWVLMDIKMPGTDGLTTMRCIRNEFPSARIIVVSNFDDPDFRTAARRSGASGYVLKENLSELQSLMR